ncbi:MAG: vWA domain-containing protein [Planctomycetota bacterium]|nr:vWA domain-containing protein [Planctomycetota bacterium]
MGQWLVAGGSRIRLDKGEQPLEDAKPPAKLHYGAVFSALQRRKKPLLDKFRRAIFSSPVWFFSFTAHLILLAVLFLVPLKTSEEIREVILVGGIEHEEEEDQKIREDLESSEEQFKDFEDEILEEQLDEISFENEIPAEFASYGKSIFEEGDEALPPPGGDQIRGRLPRPPVRPNRDGSKPSIIQMRRMGMDIVFMFDTTASMDNLLNDVKTSIDTIYNVTFKLVRTTRFACVAYRDFEPLNEYVTRTRDFTNDLTELKYFLNNLDASGGGDLEEAVQEGLHRVKRLRWRRTAYRVLIVFTDAPSHERDKNMCFKWAERFRNQGRLFALGTR